MSVSTRIIPLAQHGNAVRELLDALPIGTELAGVVQIVTDERLGHRPEFYKRFLIVARLGGVVSYTKVHHWRDVAERINEDLAERIAEAAPY